MHIREDIFRQTGLTASAGVAPNKFLAKVASDWNKPNGLFVIKPSQVASFYSGLTLKENSRSRQSYSRKTPTA